MAEGTEVTVEGIVADDPAGRGAGSRFRLRPEGGTALLQVDLEEGRPRYGDRLRLTGRIRPPEVRPEVDMREVLARHGVLGQMRAREWTRLRAGEGSPLLRGLYAARGFVRDRLRGLLPDPEAGLLIGILLGDESGIPLDGGAGLRPLRPQPHRRHLRPTTLRCSPPSPWPSSPGCWAGGLPSGRPSS
jgi:hypothetical protein